MSKFPGDVTLYRLNWQKLWTLPGAKRTAGAATDSSTAAEVTALSWRPDGKVLAVGYDDNHLILLDIEVCIFYNLSQVLLF